jgi:SAM-dependent methyltransferase
MPRKFPMPPAVLSSRIGGRDADYETIGAAHASALRSLLPPDWDWSGKRVLDFGCGTGRTLIQFADEAQHAELWGSDIDEPSVRWASENLSPPFHFLANADLPPIDLPDGTFDLAYGFSVFTHLLETWPAWLLEMHRLLRAGGLGVFTFLGEGMFHELSGREWDESRVGMIELDAGRPWSVGGPNALHSEWWLRAHWGRLFEVVQVVPCLDLVNRRSHGVVVLRKDERRAPTAGELLELEPGEPREIASLALNVDLLKERSASLWSAEAGATRLENDFLRAELERLTQSRSWRLTKPLRRLRARGG